MSSRAAGAAALLILLQVGQSSPTIDFQRHCESLVERLTSPAPRLRFLGSQIERNISLPGSAWGFLGAEWNQSTRTLALFDGQDGRVVILDTLGAIRRAVGRAGQGPAEFRLSPVYFGSRQKFRFAADGRLLVLDDRFGHVFDGTRQIQEVQFEPRPTGLVTDGHVARWREGWLVSMTHPADGDGAARAGVYIYLVRDTSAPRLVPSELGTVTNGRAQTLSANGPSTDSPYYRLFRRTWDASGAGMTVLSYHRFAVCTGPTGDTARWRAFSVAAVARRVDARERERVLKERFGKATGSVPMVPGLRIEQVYDGRWPATAPFYHDLTALNDTAYAALRLDPEGGITADLFGIGAGYVGSVRIPLGRSVLGGYSNGLLLLDSGEGTVEFLRIPK